MGLTAFDSPRILSSTWRLARSGHETCLVCARSECAADCSSLQGVGISINHLTSFFIVDALSHVAGALLRQLIYPLGKISTRSCHANGN
jgi:hypothetical protein